MRRFFYYSVVCAFGQFATLGQLTFLGQSATCGQLALFGQSATCGQSTLGHSACGQFTLGQQESTCGQSTLGHSAALGHSVAAFGQAVVWSLLALLQQPTVQRATAKITKIFFIALKN